MKLVFIILSLAYQLMSCGEKLANSTPANLLPQNDTLSINIDIQEKNRLYFLDDFGNYNPITGQNKIACTLPFFELIDGNYKITYVLKKGESVKIVNDGEYLKLITGDSTRNRELNFHVEYFKKFDSTNYMLWYPRKSFLDDKYVLDTKLREAMFDKEKSSRYEFLNEYKNKYNLSSDFVDIHKKIIDYNIASRKLAASLKKFDPTYLQKIVDNTLPLLKNDSMLFLSNYRGTANSTLHLLKTLNPLASYDSLIEANFKSETKGFLMANLIYNSAQSGIKITKNEIDQLAEKLVKSTDTKRYKEDLKKEIRLKSSISNDDELFNLKLQKVVLSNIKKDKLIYLDFWASWCAPCRMEMPASKTLSKEYESKGIEFVYISLDQNPIAWKNAVKLIGLKEEANYLLPGGYKSALAQQFKLSSIPRYMVMNKEGRIINQNAPRPSDPSIKEFLNNLAKQSHKTN